MSKILIVEDEDKVLRILSDFLISESYEVIKAEDGITGKLYALSKSPDIILLDIMLPKKNGYDVCKELRAEGVSTPIIMLTAKGQEMDKVLGLELGADDYMTKPFGLMELNARIRALLRRTPTTDSKSVKIDNYEFSGIHIDFKKHKVINQGKQIALSSTELKLLYFLISNAGETVSREDIYCHVWGYDTAQNTRSVDTHILNLRKKLEQDCRNPEHLLTVHGFGYKFID